MAKTKHEMREAVIKRLKEHRSFPDYYRELIKTIVGDDLDELTSDECIGRIIYLLTDDESYEDDAYTMGPRDADGIFWFRGDMSDSPWGVIEGVVYDCTRREWLVRGHDISAPWVPADSIRHAPMRTATQRENDLIELIKDAARDYQANVELWHGVASEQTKYINRETMTFPRDADGKAIRIGDELCGYGYPNGGVRCKAIVNERTILAGTDDAPYRDWLMWDAWSCRHYHKPTVEDVLREFAVAMSERMHLSNGVATTSAEYAPKLQVKEAE
jgi:hypothetical protein